jgi:hypothetical protein
VPTLESASGIEKRNKATEYTQNKPNQIPKPKQKTKQKLKIKTNKQKKKLKSKIKTNTEAGKLNPIIPNK